MIAPCTWKNGGREQRLKGAPGVEPSLRTSEQIQRQSQAQAPVTDRHGGLPLPTAKPG